MPDFGPAWNELRLVWLMAAPLGLLLVACPSFSTPPDMVRIAPGPFPMGTNEQDTEERGLEFGLTKPWFEDEGPARSVTLPGYFIDRHEVTNSDYARFVQEIQSAPPKTWGDGIAPQGEDLHPVTNVSWFQAESYCRWVNKRLPSEAEWEKAARGPDGFIYPWGNQFESDRANLLTTGTRPVGSFPRGASPYGVQDMIGNAWEWTADWYLPYPGNTTPSDNYGKRHKVIRGKSWTEGFGHFSREESIEILHHEARSSFRLFFDPTFSFGDLGFRCARDE
jgi:formylglycine-generating enzyme required for sulfatase activity